jgi:hypothetical protein
VSKALPILVLTTLLGAVSALWAWSEVSVARGERDAAVASQGAAEERLARVQTQLRTVKSNYATTNLRLDQALRGRVPAATPESVRKLLCERGKCSRVESVPTPGD